MGNEATVAHDRRVRGERKPFAEVVGHEHERSTARFQRLKCAAQRRGTALIETGVRLIQQHDTGVVHDCARDRNALLHSSTQ
jgi:hypothetical protein